MSQPHLPVLLKEFVENFSHYPIHRFVDGTLGAGGHAEALLQTHPEIETFIGIDQDPQALQIAQNRLEKWTDKLRLFHSNFTEMDKHLTTLGIQSVDGILLDLGVSSMQFDQAEKGFSFMRDGPLDMRMNPKAELTAAEVINEWSEHDIAVVFRDYGEEKKWRAAARTVVASRSTKRIETTHQLVEVLKPVFPPVPPWKAKKSIHPMTLIFQALRICVNSELDVLKEIVPKAIELLSVGGKLAIISFHSLEDRIVKNILRFAASDKHDTSGLGGGVFLDKDPTVKIITRKPLIATDEEIQENPRSRSAKMRIVEKL